MTSARFYQCLEVVLYIATHSGAKPISSKEICEHQGVKPRHLEPFMQILVKNGILKGTKGPKGGYTLAKEKRKITTADIYNAIILQTQLEEPSNNNIRNDVIKPLAKKMDIIVAKELKSITIEELCGEISNKNSLNKNSEGFHI